jgi:secreted trypsin-like serine protease
LQLYNDENVKCTYTQVGIVSFGPLKCGKKGINFYQRKFTNVLSNKFFLSIGIPGIYTNVFHFLEWIEGIVWPVEAENHDY